MADVVISQGLHEFYKYELNSAVRGIQDKTPLCWPNASTPDGNELTTIFERTEHEPSTSRDTASPDTEVDFAEE